MLYLQENSQEDRVATKRMRMQREVELPHLKRITLEHLALTAAHPQIPLQNFESLKRKSML